jgi:hypothetical protein
MMIVTSGIGWRGSVVTAIAGGLCLTLGWRHGPTLPYDWHRSAVIDQPHGYEVRHPGPPLEPRAMPWIVTSDAYLRGQ